MRTGPTRNRVTSDGFASTRASGGRAQWQECGCESASQGRRRGTENASQRGVELASRAAFAEPLGQPAASPRSDHGGVNGVEELQSEVLSAIFVPSTGQAIFGVRLVLKANVGIHRRRSSASARRRTSSQGTPMDSPAMTRRARRSISAAQAASTSAACSASASSRLARSSAATSARSSRGNARASRRSCCARDGVQPFYTGDRQLNTACSRRRLVKS